MNTVTLADAKAHLSEIVDRVLAGERVQITRRGKPVVQISAIEQPKPPIDFDALQRLRDSMSGPVVDSESWIREFRDNERY